MPEKKFKVLVADPAIHPDGIKLLETMAELIILPSYAPAEAVVAVAGEVEAILARTDRPEAKQARIGLFEAADGGTLFLDEIGELDIALQAKLLRALQEREIRRVGGVKDIPVDVRVLAATNRDLLKMTEEKRFREDLYYRLNVLSIDVPPLRERRSDIPVLIDFFLKKHTRGTDRQVTLDSNARKLLEDYHYPGNVRQLESAIERAILLSENDTITLDDLPPEMTQSGGVSQVSATDENFKLPPEGVNFEDVERSLIMQAMDRTDNNITKSAKLLGLTFRTLQYRLEKYGIKRDGDEGSEE